MLYPAKEMMMKNGQEVWLRSPEILDAQEILEMLKQLSNETEFLLRYPEEWEHQTVEKEACFLQYIKDSANTIMIVAEVNGKIVGNCSLEIHGHMKTRHRADVAIGILQEYCGLGIGTMMIEEMVSIAKAYEVEQMELEVIEGNHRAIALYEKMGFHTIGERTNSIHLKDGRVLSEYFMIKELADE